MREKKLSLCSVGGSLLRRDRTNEYNIISDFKWAITIKLYYYQLTLTHMYTLTLAEHPLNTYLYLLHVCELTTVEFTQ